MHAVESAVPVRQMMKVKSNPIRLAVTKRLAVQRWRDPSGLLDAGW